MPENKCPLVGHAHDPRFLTLRSLQTPQGRSRTRFYIIEGIRHLARAVEHNAPIESIFLDPSVLSNPFGQKLARRLRKRGVVVVRLSPRRYRCLTLASEPQGIGAVGAAAMDSTPARSTHGRRIGAQTHPEKTRES